MIVLTDDDVNGVRQYIAEITRFLETYTWLTGAYVSDFFFKDYWSKLPQGWQRSLCQIQTDSLADLLTHKQITSSSSIPPLSLLCFQACCQKLSLDRHQEKDVQDAIGKLTDAACSINQGIESDAATMQPTDVSGQLHAYFRKHVKPKKQHEITNLGKVIWHLSKARSCGRVVDVGSGLGHLARLLAFGHGLHVTSIEASDSHAPKASEYDREIDREIKKKMEMLGDRVTRPKHVTSMIYPNMTTTQFLAILDSDNRPDDQRKSNMASESDKQREATMVSKSEADKQREATMESESEADKQRETNRVSESEADKQRETNMVSESEAEKLRKTIKIMLIQTKMQTEMLYRQRC
ncbi:hypothetical protein DPMN_113504 [Dreissena polymorpha]|uniref:Methyltransferase domain-containing protein n=1 Tax=Dreissena polymorpha TaxID=45954 RepID=A0A9D4QRL8_DREPO|nr:hypothetical protein DPMN_113504 [Dreissena polymorpha]